MRWSVLVLAGALVAGGGASAPAQVFHSSAGDLVVQTAAKEFDHPWALAFLPDGRMLVTERPGRMRIVGKAAAKPEIWSYGHRNPQGLALHPTTGKLWEHEHGPRGGDEVNIIEKGKNYGWPVIGYGIDYNGAKIHESTQKAGMEQPLKYWVPSIAPSGMTFYIGNVFAPWRGSLFVGALAGQVLVRLEVDGDKAVKEERLLQQLRERIRDVREGPDGALWLATDSSSGRILRLAPAK